MLVFWQGYGFIALLAGVLPAVVHFVLAYPTPRSTALPVGLTALVSAAICLAAWRMVRAFPGRHTLYWLPFQVWALLYLVLAAWCLVNAAGLR